jgi:hypothetical protein
LKFSGLCNLRDGCSSSTATRTAYNTIRNSRIDSELDRIKWKAIPYNLSASLIFLKLNYLSRNRCLQLAIFYLSRSKHICSICDFILTSEALYILALCLRFIFQLSCEGDLSRRIHHM